MSCNRPLKTAAGGSTGGVNRARSRRVTIMKSSTGNGAKSPVFLISRC